MFDRNRATSIRRNHRYKYDYTTIVILGNTPRARRREHGEWRRPEARGSSFPGGCAFPAALRDRPECQRYSERCGLPIRRSALRARGCMGGVIRGRGNTEKQTVEERRSEVRQFVERRAGAGDLGLDSEQPGAGERLRHKITRMDGGSDARDISESGQGRELLNACENSEQHV